MSSKKASGEKALLASDKPKPRGKKGGRKPKHILPHEKEVEMTKITLRIRTDIAEIIHDEAARAGISQDEYVMRRISPEWMAMMEAWKEKKTS